MRLPLLWLLAVLALAFAHTCALGAEIVAHRGASADAPENTLAAFKLGVAQEADANECDIYLTKDGQVVVIHDSDTKRTGGVERKIAEQTLEELRRIDVGAWGKWKGKGFAEKIPTLDETLAVIPRGRKIFIEIKCGAEVIPALADALGRSSLTPEQTVIITFKSEVARAAKQKFPNRRVHLLSGYAKDKKTGEYPQLDQLIKLAKEASLDGLDLNHQFPLDASTVKKIKDAGLQVHVWTVDDMAKAKELAKAGVDSITTNRPGELRKALAEK